MLTALAYNYGNLQYKVELFIALAPVAIMGNVTDATFYWAAKAWWLILGVLSYYNLYEIGKSSQTPNMPAFCNSNPIYKKVCNAIDANLDYAPNSYNNSPAHPNFPKGVASVY